MREDAERDPFDVITEVIPASELFGDESEPEASDEELRRDHAA